MFTINSNGNESESDLKNLNCASSKLGPIGNQTFLTHEDMERARANLASGNFLVAEGSELACTAESRREQGALDRNYESDVLRHWPGGIVPYKFISTTLSNNAKSVIAQAIAHIEQNSCIQIRPATASDVHYVGITDDSNGCYASLGFYESKGFNNDHHTYNLAPGGCDVSINFVSNLEEYPPSLFTICSG